MLMESEELVEIMKHIEAKGIGWDKVEDQIKVSYNLLKLYANSGPVPLTIVKILKELLED